MSSVIILLVSVACALVGRWSFGRWYNHVTLYSMVWGVSLAMFEIRFINYYSLESETWIYIVAASFSFLLGSLVVGAVRKGLGYDENEELPARTNSDLNRTVPLLPLSIWFLTSIALVVSIYQWQILLKLFGSIQNALFWGNIIYSLRVRQELPGTVPYLDSFALSAACLAGIYAGRRGKFQVVSFFPILVILVGSIAGMGRAKLFLGGILFISGYFLSRSAAVKKRVVTRERRIRRFLAVGLMVVLLVAGFEAVRSLRRAGENIQGARRTLGQLRTGAFIVPSTYLYLTVHYGVLNAYVERQDEKPPWGGNTFAPFMRILYKFDAADYVSDYQKHYRTPAGSNTGTYIREFHADFGFGGVLLMPMLIGIFASALWYRRQKWNKISTLVLLAHIYVIVVMSVFYPATRLGYWWVSLVLAWVIGWIADRRRRIPSLNSWNSQ